MGLFFPRYKVKPLNEVELDGQSSENEDGTEGTTDYSAQAEDGDNTTATTEEPTDNNDNPPEDQSTSNNEEDNTSADDTGLGDGMENPEDDSTDYSAMGDEGSNDNTNDNNSNSTPSTNNDGEQSSIDELKRQEEEMYADLTPEQLDIKHRELKTQFLSMFDLTTQIIERINDAATTEENMPIIEFVSNKLSSLRDMMTDYINSVYKTKSYIENSINYNKFLAILNGINKILEEMNQKEVK